MNQFMKTDTLAFDIFTELWSCLADLQREGSVEADRSEDLIIIWNANDMSRSLTLSFDDQHDHVIVTCMSNHEPWTHCTIRGDVNMEDDMIDLLTIVSRKLGLLEVFN
jgi:hypothetical protein